MDEIRHSALKSEALLFTGPKHMRDSSSLAAVNPRDKDRDRGLARRPALYTSTSVPLLNPPAVVSQKKKE